MAAVFSQRFNHWLDQRLPKAREVTLNQRRIFIVPSKTAFAAFVAILVLFILGINFQNSLIYAVSFWLLALLIVNIFYTYRNLSGLTISAIGIEPCFAGDNASIEIAVSCAPKQSKIALQLGWDKHDTVAFNLLQTHSVHQILTYPTEKRGYFSPPSLTIATYFPTGFAVAWSYIALDMRGLVYPKPQDYPFVQQGAASDLKTEDGIEIANGTNEFGGVRDYQIGDSPKHIHWAKYAQTNKLYTKAFVDYGSHDVWLDWQQLHLASTEAKLSYLCFQVLAFSQAQRQFGLKLPQLTLAPNKGEAHKNQCLRALALYGLDNV